MLCDVLRNKFGRRVAEPNHDSPKKIHRLIHVQIYRPKSVLFYDIVHHFLDTSRHIWRVDDEFSQIVSTRELLVHGNVEELLTLASERIFEYFFNIREPVFDCVFSFVDDVSVHFLFRDGVEIVKPIQIGLKLG